MFKISNGVTVHEWRHALASVISNDYTETNCVLPKHWITYFIMFSTNNDCIMSESHINKITVYRLFAASLAEWVYVGQLRFVIQSDILLLVQGDINYFLFPHFPRNFPAL